MTQLIKFKHQLKIFLRKSKLPVVRFCYRKQLRKLAKYQIFALPTIDWNTPLYQRPQHLALALSKSNIPFIYSTCNLKYDQVNGFENLSNKLVITDKWFLCLNSLNCLILLLSTQQLVTVSDVKKIIVKGGKIIYDYVDEIHQDISGSQKMEDFLIERHSYIKESGCASLVLCVSKKLYDEMLEYYPKEKVLLVPNGVEYDHFQAKRNLKTVPDDLKKIVAKKKTIIGYYGAMANWLDYELINTAAKKHPEWQFVFIGVDYNGGLKKLDISLNNIHFLGQKDYQDLPQYGIWFDIALIPFAKGEIAKSTSPLKMYEYMAMHKPIVATEDLVECYGYKGVYISKNNNNDFEFSIKKAINSSKNMKIINFLDKQAKQNTWEIRATKIINFLKKIK